jgi:hypothetical protein
MDKEERYSDRGDVIATGRDVLASGRDIIATGRDVSATKDVLAKRRNV